LWFALQLKINTREREYISSYIKNVHSDKFRT